MNLKVIIIFLIIINFFTNLSAETNHLKEGKELFKNEKYKKARIKFEKDIVFNPKSEKSYLYLAKIFNNSENDEEEEINLKNVLIINPQNDEAIYMLTILKIKQSDYDEAKKLISTFNMVCNTFCSKKDEIKKKFEKLKP